MWHTVNDSEWWKLIPTNHNATADILLAKLVRTIIIQTVENIVLASRWEQLEKNMRNVC